MQTNTHELQIFDRENVELPRWRIDKETGYFVHDWGDASEQLQVAILKVDTSRVMWPERFREGNMALCRSHNTLWPVERDPAKNGYGLNSNGVLICHGCPMADWGEADNGDRLKPRCAWVWNVLMMDLEVGLFGVLSLTRTRAKTGRRLMGFWQMSNFRFPAVLTTDKVRGPSGEWWGVEFKREQPFDESFREHVAEIAAQFREWDLSSIAADETGEPDEPEEAEAESFEERVEMMRGEPETGIE